MAMVRIQQCQIAIALSDNTFQRFSSDLYIYVSRGESCDPEKIFL